MRDSNCSLSSTPPSDITWGCAGAAVANLHHDEEMREEMREEMNAVLLNSALSLPEQCSDSSQNIQ